MRHGEFLQILPELIVGYQPSPSVLAKIEQVQLLMVIGPSGVGKTTIINGLGIPYVPSDTTRGPRPGEQDGADMNFLSDHTQVIADIKGGKFVQAAVGPSGDFYATRASSYPDSGWATMPMVADVVPIIRKLGFKNTLSAFITPPSFEEWMRRMGSHHLDGQQLQKRLAEAKRSFNFALGDPQTHFVLNDAVSDAVVQIKALLDGNIDQKREALARQAAQREIEEINL